MNELPLKDISDRQLKISYWYITHKLSLRWWLMVLLNVAAFGLWVFVGWQLVFYVINYNREEFQTRQMLFSSDIALSGLERIKPQPLQFSTPSILTSGGNRYDFLVNIVNPNRQWLTTFDYQFNDSRGAGDIRKGFVLPGENKSLLGLGLIENTSQIKIFNQKWQRINGYDNIKNIRSNFIISNQKFSISPDVAGSSIASFEVTNGSAYSYWQAGMQVFLLSGGNIVSANYTLLNQFNAGEKRLINLYWNTPLPPINSVQIIPDVNILDQNNIIPPKATE